MPKIRPAFIKNCFCLLLLFLLSGCFKSILNILVTQLNVSIRCWNDWFDRYAIFIIKLSNLFEINYQRNANNVLKFLIKYDQSVCKKRLLKKIFSNVFECPVGAALCAIMRIFLLQNLMKKIWFFWKIWKKCCFFTFYFLTQF